MRSWGRWICARVAGETLGVGCGAGEIATLLEREGHLVTEVDPERAGALPFDDESFDTVLLGAFITEWTSRERPIAEARRVLRPGGRLIVAVPYAGIPGEEQETGISLETLLPELTGFSVKEMATVDGRLCLLAERGKEKNRAAVWRQALGVAEQRLAERDLAVAALAASVAELEASFERESRALADARGDVVRLETALAAAAHRRDLHEERARLAADGAAALEQGIERLRREGEKEQVKSERELAAVRARLEERTGELERTRAAANTAQSELIIVREELALHERALVERERDFENTRRALESRDVELERLRASAREHEQKLALSEARLESSQERAEAFRRSLVALRQGRAYSLMRVLWRLRRPFRRAPRASSATEASAADDADSAAPAAAARSAASLAAPSLRAAARTPPRPPGSRLRVASILDEMSEACFAPECDLLPLAVDGWREQLDERDPDLLLVESAWNGSGGEWRYRIARYPRRDLAGLPALRALLDDCRERGIPTAFWNKEDPVHFDRFAEAASLFDHVFTTDVRCVERYRALPGARTVDPLPFAAQPRIHNPVAVVTQRSASPCFAGAWYRDRHPDRRRALEALLDAARPHGLVIYDRRFGGDDGAYGFPDRFAPHVLGRLPYERILDVYKSHQIFLNANSVADSPTMCSRRVFELAACDTAILSTPGAALTALLGAGAVEEAGDEEAAAAALERLLDDDGERARRARAARRAVFSAHTYAERLVTIAETAGLDASSLRREPFADAGAARTSANGASDGPDRHPWQLHLQPQVTLSEAALADLAAATTFADADVIGACPARNGDPAVEHRHVAGVDPRALLLRRELVESRGLPAGSPEEVLACLREWSDDGVRIYAADADLLSTPAMANGPR